MRPSDENQHGTTRPNLMSSSRRGGNSDDSILARMDKARGLSARARTAWLAAAGGLIAVLIATVAWLAHTSMTTPHPLPIDGVAATLPPLVMLPRTPVAAAAPPPAVRMPARMPAPVPVRVIALAPHAAAPQPKPAAPPRAVAAVTPTPAPPHAQRLAAARKARPAPATEAPEAAPVDLDIALISAVVASRHRAEQAACAGGAHCPPKP